MKFAQYKRIVEQHGHFSVRLGDNRIAVGISDERCREVFQRYLRPLILMSQKTYVYRGKTLNPPPSQSAPIILSRAKSRVELDASKMISESDVAYWSWALRRQCITFVLQRNQSFSNAFASGVWDPTVIANLGVLINRSAITLAKRETINGNMCCILSRDAYNNNMTVFAPKKTLIETYEFFALNCQFVLKDLKRDLKGKI